MRSRLALAFIPLLLLALLPGAAGAASPPNGPTLPDAAAQRRAAVLAYWTPARIAAAIPRDFVFDGAGFKPEAKPAVKPAVKPSRSPKPTPTPTPTPDLSADTLGSSWTSGGIMLEQTGVVLFTMGTTDYRCSGSVVEDGKAGTSIVLTAGHCVVENDGTFATNWLFIPAFDSHPTSNCPDTEYGCWVADRLYADEAFATAGTFNDTAVTHDWGFALVGPGGHERDEEVLDATLGALDITFSGALAGAKASAFGYPAAGKYNGTDLVYCRGTVGTDPRTAGGTYALACNLTGGASGGPWVEGSLPTATTAGDIGSVNSYKYTNDAKHMYGPIFNTDTQAVYNAANAGVTSSSGNVVTAPNVVE